MDNLEIWVVPVVNPDGYAHTASPSGYRYWRKNRRNNGDGTFGIDLNRNWGHQWGLASGSSGATNDDVYRGPSPFSEPETRAIRDLVNSVGNLKALVTYHTFSEFFLRPWAYTTADPPGEPTLNSIVERSIGLIAAVHGHTYTEEIWYTSSGEATDYLWGEKRVAAFTPELRPAFNGVGGFSPPTTEIIPTAEENLPAALALVHDAGDREVWIRDYPGDTGAEPSAVWTGSGWSQAFWVSPDIWTDPVELAEGTTVDLKVRISNNSGGPMSNVEVSAYWNDPRISLEFPALNSTLIGTQTVNVPPPGKTITIPWTVPTGTNSWGERHWCVGVVIKHPSDMPLTNQAERTSNIGIKNFNTTVVTAAQTLLVGADNFLDVDAELKIVVDTTRLPRGWRVVLPRWPQPRPRPRPGPDPLPDHRRISAIERKGRLLGATGMLLPAGESALIPVRVIPPRDARRGTAVDIDIQGALLPLVAGKRQPVGNGYRYHVVIGGQ
jgi:hypothetical protein